jgi:hypothetical protein
MSVHAVDGVEMTIGDARLRRMEAIHTDFTGYEGQYVAIDWRTGEIVLADEDPRVVLEQAKGRNHVVVHGRVPYADEPLYVGLG